MAIDQNPQTNVETKFSKHIPGIIFNFDKTLVRYVHDWVTRLKDKGWRPDAPLFPRSKLERNNGDLCFMPSTNIEPFFWESADSIRDIFETRAQAANLPYFQPNTFRHGAVALALRHAKNGEEIKAISQNFGHEHVATTLACYGKQPKDRLIGILHKIDFPGTPKQSTDDKIEELTRLVKTVLSSKQ